MRTSRRRSLAAVATREGRRRRCSTKSLRSTLDTPRLSHLEPLIKSLACIAALCGLIGCVNEDPAPIFVKLDYQTRCFECQPRAADDPAHAVHALDGYGGYHAACDRDAWGDETGLGLSLETTATQVNGNDGFAFEIHQAQLGPDPGPSCRITVREGANSYEGACGGAPPSDDVPCQLATRLEGGVLSGTVICESIPNAATGAFRRSVVKSGTRDPAEFEVHGCPRL